MASFTLEEYADHIGIAIVGADGHKVYRSFTNDFNYADQIKVFPAGPFSTTLDDYWCLQGHTYYYWLYTSGDVLVQGPTPGKLKQYKLFGRRAGGTIKKSLDYDVACPLCGKTCRRSQLRKGYVKPFLSGVNYCPNGFGPENWVYGGSGPAWFDINAKMTYNNILGYDWSYPERREDWEDNPGYIQTPLFCPLIDKDPGYDYPPTYFHWPGIPVFESPKNQVITIGTTTTNVEFFTQSIYGVPQDAVFFESWFMCLTVANGLTKVEWSWDGGGTWTTQTAIDDSYRTWVRVGKSVSSGTWDGLAPSVIKIRFSGSGNILFGGIKIQSQMHPSLWPGTVGHDIITGYGAEYAGNPNLLPDRLSGIGKYMTGGMMDQCPECWSGLRKRVPWE